MANTWQSNEASNSLSILQIEDNRTDAELALHELSNAGFEVSADVVDTLADAVSHLAAKSYDAVLADYRLPGWVGTDALPIARKYQADVPFILVTGALGDELAVECVKNGATDCVLKDHLVRLPITIRHALREKSLSEQRNRALKELAESEERFRSLVEASPDAIFVHLEGKLVFANPATLALLGARTLEEIKKKDLSEIVHPDDLSKIKMQIAIVLERGIVSAPIEHTCIKMDGSSVAVESIGIPITWAGSRAIEVVVRDITARKLTEKKIAHLASFPELNPTPVFETNLEGNVTYANSATARVFPELLQPGPTHALLKDWPAVIELLRTGQKQGITREIETDGSLFLQSIHHTAELGVIRAYLLDITEQKRAEKLRKANEKVVLEWKARLELAERAALPIGLWEWDLGTDIRSWSGEIYRQLGYGSNDFRGTGEEFLNRLHHEDRPRVEAAIRTVLSGRSQSYEVQFRIIRPDGTTCWLDSRGVMVRDGSPRMIGISIDITKLRRSQAEYRAIVETAPYGVYRSNSEGRFVMANPALTDMLGYDTESEVLALDIARDVYCKPDERARLVGQLTETQYLKDFEADWKRKDGRTITVRMSVIPVRNIRGEIEGFQGFIQDVTERKLLRTQFWLAQKYEAVGRLAGGVAHDFNNVLMVVSSYADLILQRQTSDEKVVRYAGQLHQAATRAASVTRQLLAFSRQQVLEPEVLDLNAIVSDLGKILPKLLGEDITVVTTPEPMLWRVKVDHGQIDQVIMNLAVNARDAMLKGGRFEIKTENVKVDNSFAAEHPPMTPGVYVRLSVTDTGIGMDAETQLHIFEPFYTTKERGKGTGLGLAMVYGVVKQTGGFVWVTSEVGRGTTFDIYFPQVEAPLRKPSKPYVASATSEGSETILLVEDDVALRAAAGEFLELRGYTVLAACDGAEAIRVCERHAGDIDAILTDLVMPGMDGIELAKVVSVRYPDICVLYMSGYTDRSMEGRRAGTILLQKPFALSDLACKLRTVLGTRKPARHRSPGAVHRN